MLDLYHLVIGITCLDVAIIEGIYLIVSYYYDKKGR